MAAGSSRPAKSAVLKPAAPTSWWQTRMQFYARAQAANATIVRPLAKHRLTAAANSAVKDPEGHTWSVGTYDPWVKHE